MSEADIRSDRLRKLGMLKEAGMDPYPVSVERDYDLVDFLARFDALDKDRATVSLVGRIMSLRGQGGIMFADLFDGTGRGQAVFQKDEMDTRIFTLFADSAEVGDFVQVKGTPFVTKRGERSLKVSDWHMAAKATLPIPDEWFGIKDEEKRLRERYLDVLLDPELRAMFERRSKFWQTVRSYYLERGFLEVEMPVLENSPGGADARPFITRHNALDIDVYLRIALELWLKRLLVAGFPKVFEIGRVFRNEGQSREHVQDFTFLESYESFSDMTKGKQFIQDLYRRIAKEVYGKYTFEIRDHTVDLAEEWREIDFCELLRNEYGIDPLTCTEADAVSAVHKAGIQAGEALNLSRAVDHLWKVLRKKISGPAFLTGVPVYMEPLAKRSPQDPRIVERFQVILAGSEMGKGFSELNDPVDQRERFEAQQALRDAGDDEAQRLDEDYVRAMEHGMPPSFGFGVSERLFAFLENKPIHEAQYFPLLRPRQ